MNLLIFPNQLYREHPGLKPAPECVVLIEDSLFFGDARYTMRMHQQKIWLHRATMKRFERLLETRGLSTKYLEYDSENQSLRKHLRGLADQGVQAVATIEPVDFMLRKRLERDCSQLGISIKWLSNPGFLNSTAENQDYRSGKKRWYMADYYKWQRKRLDILMDGEEPVGGQWSFDGDNRKKIPKNQLDSIPPILHLSRDEIDEEAKTYVQSHFSEHYGNVDTLYFPTSHKDAERWLLDFIRNRFNDFGNYEDAILEGESWLWHSVLTPSLNIGLLTPQQVIDAALRAADERDLPINSVEGFVRQIIGWREFMRATYEDLGVSMRTTNFWEHSRPMPDAFYDGTTGVLPIDDTIRRILDTGYCHHIERLMVLGGFMFLCEIRPDDIYRWFMEMFVDSYDWVMVPNAYAMSQNADGGQITTKPYFSGSSYVRKMSHYKSGPWCDVWDGLYWRWISNHAESLAKNPRWAMMCSTAKKMAPEKLQTHHSHAERFLSEI